MGMALEGEEVGKLDTGSGLSVRKTAKSGKGANVLYSHVGQWEPLIILFCLPLKTDCRVSHTPDDSKHK